ncbi:hypothetical protein TNCV_3158011 [Trichonephila clavipes]|nr:hypothetical protein TNCV_3158011 [Trichonephila clavipes]
MARSLKNPLKTSILSCDHIAQSAATKHSLHHFQQGYEFRNNVEYLFNGFLCKAVSTSATFVFTMDALPDRFHSATDPMSRKRCTKSVIVDAFCAVSSGYLC